ncbi:hypothetical protein DEU56DRAFT_826571, partial [Suillus clintonianus]|uniref:uncharacterized protein n=1 Tax=Suillus clintonianus TaxID=1904413 RepID=UPI001B8847C7
MDAKSRWSEIPVACSPQDVSLREKFTEVFFKPFRYTGRILVKSYDGEQLGHLYNWASGINGVNFGDSSADLHVSFTKPRSEKGLIDIQVVRSASKLIKSGDYFRLPDSSEYAAFPGSCYIGSTSNDTLAHGSSTAVGFGNVIRTPVHSPPVPVGQNNADESAIWTFDPKSLELKVHYVNLNGHKAKTTIAYNIYDNTIFFVGDIRAYNAAQVNPDYHVSPITFYLDSGTAAL